MLCSRWRCSELRRSPPPCGGGDDGGGGPFGNAGGGPAPTEDGDGGGAAGGSGTAGCVLRLTLSGAIEKEIDWDEDEVDCGGLGSPGEGMDVGFVYNEDDRSVLINFQVGTLAAGEIDNDGFFDLVESSTPSVGYCNTMGTATTMNSLTEALGMSLPGCGAIPAPYRERGQIAYDTGLRIVDMVWEDLKPSDILTRQAFENAIVVNSSIGGSTNAPIHLNAIARHIGVELDNDDWYRIGYEHGLLVNLQPAGEYLGEDYHRAGGVPAVVGELLKGGRLPHPGAITANGKSIGENCAGLGSRNPDVIRPHDQPMVENAGFINLKGNLFDSAIMKSSVISDEFRQRYLANPEDPGAFEGRAVVFEGPEDYHHRIDDPALEIGIDSLLFIRGVGPIGYPGGAEVVNMQPPAALILSGVHTLPCIGDGRQSGTSGSPSILNAAPEAAAGGGLAILETGDRVRIDLNEATANILISEDEVAARHQALADSGGFGPPESQTPWQEIFRERVAQFDDGMILKGADKFKRVAAKGTPRNNH